MIEYYIQLKETDVLKHIHVFVFDMKLDRLQNVSEIMILYHLRKSFTEHTKQYFISWIKYVRVLKLY